jgi:hypothetical protein
MSTIYGEGYVADMTEEQKRAELAIWAAFDEWKKTQRNTYARAAFMAGAVWMANTIDAKLQTAADWERTPPPCRVCGSAWWTGDPPKCMRCGASATGVDLPVEPPSIEGEITAVYASPPGLWINTGWDQLPPFKAGQRVRIVLAAAGVNASRRFTGVGYLEETGYIPAGSAAEREGCTRSHPHENMDEECERKTVQARAAAGVKEDGNAA